ncbi:AAA family ATPase [Herbivorax sp. ANBcel31]|uniref:AAA family ATPase n=1 Tax=Herbivorax sp. ANBcel31 TaxID=3069754 RepID=UPI0027B67BFC|nr:AAA family ATPase [Herbivorax sp. ANBcel31]MDQ2087986.1 AAA family ATPase [Herbivorax sp. ANBcel31]
MKRQPVGVDDFKKIIKEDLYFVDKTLFIKEIIDDGSEIILISRPRRFGKTLNMSLLKYYFEKSEKDNSYMFKSYKIWAQGEEYTKEQGKYPVITLTFKNVKTSSWDINLGLIKKAIQGEFNRHLYLEKSKEITESEKKEFKKICFAEGSVEDYINSLELLSKMLYKHHKQKPYVLLDEYDTILNEAYIHGHWQESIEFMKAFMSAGFKNNPNLYKGVLTGIFRVARGSIFSDMNNLNVCTIFSDNYSEYFGFTQGEVEEILNYYGIEEGDKVREWYNGYLFGKKKQTVIYNPWSIVMYIHKGILEPYWINTSGNAIIKELVTTGDRNIQFNIQNIIEGGTVDDVKIDENIVYSEIKKSDKSIWSFMLMSGYLKPVKLYLREEGVYCDLKAPNKEVYYFFRNILENWFDETIKGGSVNEMLKALLSGDIYTFHEIFARTVRNVLSYNDVGEDRAESFYHAFVLGMLVYIDKEYNIKSNRESGYGRYDVMIIPKDKSKKGIIIEFKKASDLRGETIDKALEAALKQIEDKKYDEELKGIGINDIVKIGIAFKGKEVKVESV